MPQARKLSSEVIDSRRAETMNAQTVRKSVPVRDIDIISESVISYQGHYVEMDPKAFTQLMRIIGMSKTFAKQFENLFNAETKARFINTIKNAMANNLNEITIVLSPISKKVVGFSKTATQMISNERFLGIADGIIGDHGFDVANWSVNSSTGAVTINAIHPNSQVDVGIDNEIFTTGITLKNSPFGGIEVSPYVNRLWCANGCTTSMAEDHFTLHNLEQESMETFFQNLNNLRKNGFVPTGFGDIVKRASQTPASLNEMERAHRWISNHVGDRADSWIPLQSQYDAYNSINVNPNELTTEQKKRCKTDQSIWSVVNGVTHVATHAADMMLGSNIKPSDETELMVSAGQLLGKDYDMSNEMPSPFAKNVLKETAQVGAMLN